MAEAGTRPRKRGEGQWGLGYFEPLNPAERAKRDDDGLNVRARIESKYAKQGFRSIDKTDSGAGSDGGACTPSGGRASPAGPPPRPSPMSSRTSSS